MDSTLLQQVRVIDPVSGTDQIADVLISKHKIQAIAPHLSSVPEDTVKQDGDGLVLAPGLVDLYTHSGQPGYEERETFSSLAAAAIAGGFTQVAILPNTLPPVDTPASLTLLQQQVAQLSAQKSGITSPHFYFWGALTSEVAGVQMSELANLATAGVIGFADGSPIANLGLLRRLLEYLKPFKKPVALMATDALLANQGVVREGVLSVGYGLPGNPAVSEAAALAALLEVVAMVETPVHVMRLSTARGVELVAGAKARGLPITASTTWMHLLVNSSAAGTYEPNLRLEPPLGNPADQKALIKAVQTGVIDAIAVDHTPYTYEEKTVAFAQAPPGVIGLELALPLLWQTFVATGEWSAAALWHCLSSAPQRCLGQQPTRCIAGESTELVLFDPQQTWSVDQQNLKSASSNTPWLGKQVTGRVVRTWH